MKKSIVILVVLTGFAVSSCTQEGRQTAEKEKNNAISPVDVVLGNLDKTLSPFEDMTEFALNQNDEGLQKSLSQVISASKSKVFDKNINPENIGILYQKIAQLEESIFANNYPKVALLSAEIFEFNISNFIESSKIKNQIKIEHLDYLGFQTLVLLNQEQIDWKELENSILEAEKVWKLLSGHVRDKNLSDSFEYLFEGLHLCAKHHDVKMAGILASMDLSLVDVLENTI